MEESSKTAYAIDKSNYTLSIKREFLADRKLVWDCFTKSEKLEQWFAPEPFSAKTKSMNFAEGGYWLYAMIEPNGTEHWGRTDYLEIKPKSYYKCLDGFSDKDGKINPNLPRANWLTSFSDLQENTILDVVITYDSPKDLQMVMDMGMTDGLNSTFERLDVLLENSN